MQLKYKKMNFCKSVKTFKKDGGLDRSVSDNPFSLVTLNELAMNARKLNCKFKLRQRSHTMTDINSNEFQIIQTV